MKSVETTAVGAATAWRVRVGDLQVDLRDRTVRRGSLRLPVEGRSFQLLQCLIERHPETAGHRELLDSVWRGRVVTLDALAQRVRLLRKALGDDRGDEGYITSVHGQGYRLARTPAIAPVPEDLVRARFANARAVAWVVFAAATSLLAIVLESRMPHVFKHFFRHLL